MAQQGIIIPTTSSALFPGCALSCTTLLQAQDICMPPNVPSSTQLQYDECFCTSPYLRSFATSADAVCTAECSLAADRQLLQAWYNNFCVQVGRGVDPTTMTATTGLTYATATVTATQGTATVTSTATARANASNQSWIDGHWQWVLMIIILAIGLGLLAWLAVWFKRRQRRKGDVGRTLAPGPSSDPEKRSADNLHSASNVELWGPHQMMHATQGFGYANISGDQLGAKDSRNYRGAQSSTKTEKNILGLAEVEKGTRPANQRARPSDLEMNARMIGAADRRSKSRAKTRTDEVSPVDKETSVNVPEVDGAKTKTKSKTRDVDPEKT